MVILESVSICSYALINHLLKSSNLQHLHNIYFHKNYNLYFFNLKRDIHLY